MREQWRVVFFKRHRDEDPDETRPGRLFLASCPVKIAARMIAILDAVALSPPPQFTGGGMWEAMHGDMAGYYEVRGRGPQKRLYRLFCLLERVQPGLMKPSIVVIGGLVKPNGTAFTDAEYADIRALGDEYTARSPRSVV